MISLNLALLEMTLTYAYAQRDWHVVIHTIELSINDPIIHGFKVITKYVLYMTRPHAHKMI
jgi:hypothetical protein